MKKNVLFRIVLVSLALILSASYFTQASGAVISSPPGESACDTVEIYIYSAYNEAIYIDATNWSTLTRWFAVWDKPTGLQFSYAPGNFEIWINSYSYPGWYVDKSVYLPGCSKAAVYIKPGAQGPKLDIYVFPPGTK